MGAIFYIVAIALAMIVRAVRALKPELMQELARCFAELMLGQPIPAATAK